MVLVHIPAPLRALTGGQARVAVEGGTLAEVMDALECAFPGVRDRLVEGERLRPGFALFVGGTQAPSRLSQRLPDDAELYFAPAISGG